MKSLNGSELADYVKERQAKQVRNLRQSWGVFPKLAIVATTNDPVIGTYMGLKRRYGEDILVDVDVHVIDQKDVSQVIEQLNEDESVHGIIVQLPLANPDETDLVVNMVSPGKDVDGLSDQTPFTPATPMAIDWLLNGYAIELERKRIAIVGHGRLVGAPLAKLWLEQGRDVTVFDESSDDMNLQLRQFDIVVSAAGVPRLIGSDDIKIGAVVVDAATSSENGVIVGDVSDDVRARDDVTITPKKGGVGPLTVAALFDNVIAAARKIADAQGPRDR
jgi:methylenetetrahydrofolate dehydrogenase (NADP+)/methenyltetrahydrofolate cyclohydrolase